MDPQNSYHAVLEHYLDNSFLGLSFAHHNCGGDTTAPAFLEATDAAQRTFTEGLDSVLADAKFYADKHLSRKQLEELRDLAKSGIWKDDLPSVQKLYIASLEKLGRDTTDVPDFIAKL